jgi:hypothetical protein
MLKFVSIVAFCLVLAGAAAPVASAAPAAAPENRTALPSGSYEVAQNWNRRVCCKRGWQDWFTTYRACQRQGGRVVRNRQCRDDWNSNWDVRWWRWGGPDWNTRVCCKRGLRDWWTSARNCRNAGGWEAPRRHCRND